MPEDTFNPEKKYQELREFGETLDTRLQVMENAKTPTNDIKPFVDIPYHEDLKVDRFNISKAYFPPEVNNGNSGTAKTINWLSGNKQKITLTGNATLTFIKPLGVCNLILRCIGDGTGRTITWDSAVKWSGAAPTFTGTASKWYIVSFYFDGTYFSGMYSQEIG